MARPQPPRRSCLSVPGSSERMLRKAPGLGADELVLDLEDAVAPAAKDAARERGRARRRLAGVRGHAGERAGQRSAHALVPRRPDRLAGVPGGRGRGGAEGRERGRPRVRRPPAGRRGARRRPGRPAARAGADRDGRPGSRNAREIARRVATAGRADPRLRRPRRLARAHARGREDLDGWRFAQDALLVAARAHGLQAIDGPYLGIAADERFAAAATRARDAGLRRQVGDPPRPGGAAERAVHPDARTSSSARGRSSPRSTTPTRAPSRSTGRCSTRRSAPPPCGRWRGRANDRRHRDRRQHRRTVLRGADGRPAARGGARADAHRGARRAAPGDRRRPAAPGAGRDAERARAAAARASSRTPRWCATSRSASRRSSPSA